jgi:hypothetical protein
MTKAQGRRSSRKAGYYKNYREKFERKKLERKTKRLRRIAAGGHISHPSPSDLRRATARAIGLHSARNPVPRRKAA